MTAKESLKALCSNCERHLSLSKQACPFRSISNDYCEEYENIKRDLEVLDILKNHKPSFYRLNISDNVKHYNLIYEDGTTPKSFGNKILSNEEFTLLKEWLKDDTPRT